jgi:hypothetical protein
MEKNIEFSKLTIFFTLKTNLNDLLDVKFLLVRQTVIYGKITHCVTVRIAFAL